MPDLSPTLGHQYAQLVPLQRADQGCSIRPGASRRLSVGGRLVGVTDDAPDEVTGSADPASDAVRVEAVRVRRLAARRVWRLARSAEFALELAILPGRRWSQSLGASMSLQTPVAASAVVEEAVFAVWDLAREQPPPARERVYSVSGDAGRIVVAHAEQASLLARSGGPFLIIADLLGKTLWRIDGDEVWADDLAEIFRELFEVSQGRPAVDESQIAPMPRLPWHRD